MRPIFILAAVIGLLCAMVPVLALADSPAPPSSGAASSGRLNPPDTTTQNSPPAATVDAATQALINQARTQLGGTVADTLATIQQLSDAMTRSADQQTQIQQRIDDSQAKIDELNTEIQDLDDQISTTQGQIDTERTEIGLLARALYQRPDSLLLRLLSAGDLRDMLTQTSDLTAGAFRADTLEQKLSSDLTKLQQDEADRQKAADQEQQVQDQLNASLSQFQDLDQTMQDTSDQLQSVIDDGQSALDGLDTQGVAVAQEAAAMLQQREQQLNLQAESAVWRLAQLWSTLNSSAIPLPTTTTLGGTQTSAAGTRFAWPIQGAVLTQGFGPSTLWLEPAMFGFPHFHTGIDLASANARIGAAADGVVAVVGSGTTGYGNYVIIVHAGGLVTLYGHLSATLVKVGDTVTQGQQIGVEGSTGASTGVHLHFEVRLNGTPVDPMPYLPRATGA